MEHPVKEIPHIIHTLTSTPPSSQRHALETYFLPNASFQHPFCRVSRFQNVRVPLLGEINSRWVIWMIYRWYKILSPQIVLDVNSVAFDQKSLVLYVSIHQTFHLFFLPKFIYHAHVSLVTVLHLSHVPLDQGESKYFIAGQEDLYQVNEFVKFFMPLGLGEAIVWAWQWVATWICVVFGLVLAPFTWVEEAVARKKIEEKS